MKLGSLTATAARRCPFSTLNSGLRDETAWACSWLGMGLPFSTLNSGLRDETLALGNTHGYISTFSTLNSGLRDETHWPPWGSERRITTFQYPQLGPTR